MQKHAGIIDQIANIDVGSTPTASIHSHAVSGRIPRDRNAASRSLPAATASSLLPARTRASDVIPAALRMRVSSQPMKYTFILIALLAVGCGSSSSTPAAPSQPAPSPASVAGTWTGTWQATQVTGGPYLIAYVMTLNQAGANVTGTWSTAQANGTVTGTTTSTAFSGTFTWNATTNGGAACTGTFAVSGNAGGSTVSWTSPAVTASCTNLPTGITIAAQSR